MTKSEVKAIIHEVMERYVLHAEEIDDELIDENRKIFSINKSLCQAIDEAEDEAEWEEIDTDCGQMVRCTECHCIEQFDTNYCPTCGKKMKAR